MRVGFIGSGNIAKALARGWGEPVLCTDSGSGRAQALVDELGGERVGSNRALAERVDVLILAHKPYQLDTVARDIGPAALQGKTVVSLLAKTTQAELRAAYLGAAVFRVEPNTPSELGRGVLNFAVPDAPVDAATEAALKERFGQLGTVVDVPESLMPIAGAVSGVGPAYWALVAEAWTDAAIRRGMPAATARVLVRETMAGSAALLARMDDDTLALRRGVTSPGGTTARGLAALEAGGVRTAFHSAMDRAVDG